MSIIQAKGLQPIHVDEVIIIGHTKASKLSSQPEALNRGHLNEIISGTTP